jgi:hypothetical protein
MNKCGSTGKKKEYHTYMSDNNNWSSLSPPYPHLSTKYFATVQEELLLEQVYCNLLWCFGQ